jgi:hypothetical protein
VKVQLHSSLILEFLSRTQGFARSIELGTDAFEECNWKTTLLKDAGRDITVVVVWRVMRQRVLKEGEHPPISSLKRRGDNWSLSGAHRLRKADMVENLEGKFLDIVRRSDLEVLHAFINKDFQLADIMNRRWILRIGNTFPPNVDEGLGAEERRRAGQFP